MLIPSKRWKHFMAMALIGDGVLALVHPERDAEAWRAGPKAWQDLMGRLREHPGLTRTIGVAQVLGAIWWALYEESRE